MNLLKRLFGGADQERVATDEYDTIPDVHYGPGTLMTDQDGSAPLSVDIEPAGAIAARNRVLDYLRGRRNGAAVDPEFAQQSLNELGLCSVDLAEVLLAIIEERNLPAESVVDFMSQGSLANRKEANLLRRLLVAGAALSPEQRYVGLASGIIGNGAELAPFRSEYDSVAALEKYCATVERFCANR